MSNEARRNPNSPDFIDPNAPKYKVGAVVDAVAVPSKAWQERNPVVPGEPNTALCPEEDLEVVILIHGLYAEGSPLVPVSRYPAGGAIMVELGRVPFRAWQNTVRMANPTVNWRKDDQPPALEGMDS